MRNQGFLSGKHLIATILVASEGPLLQMNLINMPFHGSLGYELGLTTVLSAREESPLQLNFIDMFLQAEVNKKPVAW